jgi:hypothetical protein
MGVGGTANEQIDVITHDDGLLMRRKHDTKP